MSKGSGSVIYSVGRKKMGPCTTPIAERTYGYEHWLVCSIYRCSKKSARGSKKNDYYTDDSNSGNVAILTRTADIIVPVRIRPIAAAALYTDPYRSESSHFGFRGRHTYTCARYNVRHLGRFSASVFVGDSDNVER